MQFKIFILLVLTMLASSTGLAKGSVDLTSNLTISGGRPLHQARDFKRDIKEISREYNYIRCVNFQLVKHFGSDNYNDQEKLFPTEMADMLETANIHIGNLKAKRNYLLQHHRTAENGNIPWEIQQSINSFKKEINEFQSDFDELFDLVAKSAAGLGKTSLCDRVLARS